MVALATVLAAAPAFAETRIEGGALGDATWTAAGSPYLIGGSLSADSLVIEAGTTVLFADTDPPILLTVGTFEVNGTLEQPVTFQAATDPDQPGRRLAGHPNR